METLDKELEDTILELQGSPDLYNLDDLFGEMAPPKKKVRIGFPKTYKLPFTYEYVPEKSLPAEAAKKSLPESLPAERKSEYPEKKRLSENLEKKRREYHEKKSAEKRREYHEKRRDEKRRDEKKRLLLKRAPPFRVPSPVVTKHRDIRGVLAMRQNGYTLTDGHRSFSSTDLRRVSYDIFSLRLRTLYLVDETSHRLWDTYATNYVDTRVMDPPAHVRECPDCADRQCHRWWAFHYGIRKIVPSFSDTPLHHDESKVVHPTDVALCITSDGYTLTNGRISFSGNDDGLIDLMYKTRVKTVYVTDDCNLKLPFEVKRMQASSVGPCRYCRKGNCHRWIAVVGGISQILRHPVDPIRH